MNDQLNQLKTAMNKHVFNGKSFSDLSKEKVRRKTYKKQRFGIAIPTLVSIAALCLFLLTSLNFWNAEENIEMGLQSKFQSLFDMNKKESLNTAQEPEAEEETPLATDRVTAVRVIDQDSGWVGGYGWIARTDNQGSDWEVQYRNQANQRVKQIFALNGQYAWALLTEDEPQDPPLTLIRTTDNGENWETVGHVEPSEFYHQSNFVHFNTPEEGFVGNSYTTDGGQTWKELNTPDGIKGDAYFRNINDGWAAVYENNQVKVKRTTDGGQSWDTVMARESKGVLRDAVIRAVGDSAWVMMIGDSGMSQQSYSVFQTKDGGETWRVVINNGTAGAGPPPGLTMKDKVGHQNKGARPGEMYVVNSGVAFVGGHCPACEKPNSIGWTTDGGQTWNNSEQGFMGLRPAHIAMVNAKTGWLVTEKGLNQSSTMYVTNDGGRSWESKFQFDQLSMDRSCEKAPEVLNWSGKTYTLEEMNTNVEPVTKLGFVKCVNGEYKISQESRNAMTVYAVGTDGHRDDIMIIGEWGEVLYSLDQK